MELTAKKTIESYNTLTNALRKHKKLYFTRFGDGEIYSMIGLNSLEHNYNVEMKEELIECFTIDDPQFLIASTVNQKREKGMSVGLFAPCPDNKKLEQYIIENKLYNKSGVYENHVLFHYLTISKPKLVIEFFNEFIRPKKKMFIGSTGQTEAEKLYGKIDVYIKTPPRLAYENIHAWWPEIEKHIDEVELVIPSVGVASNVISKRLWKMNKEIHLIDIGSLIDAVIKGNISRTWIRLQGHKVYNILPKAYRNVSLKDKIIFVLKDIKCFFRSFIK